MDFTTEFDKRLEQMSKGFNTLPTEIDAAVATFERMKTAISICKSLFPEPLDQATVVAVFSGLAAASRRGHEMNTLE